MNAKIAVLATLLMGMAAPLAGAATPIDRSQATTATPSVEIVNVQGEVRVRAWDRNEVKVTGVLVNDRDELEFAGDAQRVTIRVRPEKASSRGRISDARLDVQVPRGASLEVQAVSADVAVEGVRGTQRLESVSGKVTTVVYDAELQLRSISGIANVTGAGGGANAYLETVSGSLTARGLRGEVKSQSVSGDVDLEIAGATRVRITSVSGGITAKVGLGANADLGIESVSGDVSLALPGATDAEFDVETLSGGIDNCFGPRAARKSRHGPGLALRFTEGAGSARVRIGTMSGDIGFCNR